jgi:hypothetical protein
LGNHNDAVCATFYNHCANPLALLIQVLLADLERAHFDEERRRAEGGYSAAEMLRLSVVDVADHIERFEAVYRLTVDDPADGGVYEALVRHFSEYAVSFIELSAHPACPPRTAASSPNFLLMASRGQSRPGSATPQYRRVI